VYQVSHLRKESSQSQTKRKPKPPRYEVEAETRAKVTVILAAKAIVILVAKVTVILTTKIAVASMYPVSVFYGPERKKEPRALHKEKGRTSYGRRCGRIDVSKPFSHFSMLRPHITEKQEPRPSNEEGVKLATGEVAAEVEAEVGG
jgi:hypothetical protein